MVCAWEIIHTMLGTGTRSSMYKRFSNTYPWLCHAKLKYKLAGGFPFRFSSTFWYFPLAIAVKSFVHTNFRLVHLNQKFDFLEGFAIFRVCTAKRNSENARKIYILLVLLKMASDCFISFSCVWHWNCAVRTKWPCAYILKCAYVLSWFWCFFGGSANENAFVHTPVQNHNSLWYAVDLLYIIAVFRRYRRSNLMSGFIHTRSCCKL